MAAVHSAKQQQQQQQQQQPRVLYRRPTSVGVPKQKDEWATDDGAAASPHGGPSPSARGTSAPSPTTARVQRAVSQHVVWAKDATSRMARSVPRPVSAGSAAAAAAVASANGSTSSGDGSYAAVGAAGGGASSYHPRMYGGSPNLNAAAAALAERQAMAEALSSLRPHCRCCRDGCSAPSSIGGNRKDVEGLSDEVRKLRAELVSSQEQNRVLRTERQRLEEELSRCRTNLVKAEEVLNTRERSLSPNTMFRSPATTSLVNKLREQLAAQQSQAESLRAQLDEVMRGTRATRVAELQAEAKTQDRELGRQAEMLRVMRRRMEEAEARAAEALDRCNAAERLAKMQGPLVALQQAIAASEARYGRSENGSVSGTAGPANAATTDAAAASDSSITANAMPSATATSGGAGSTAAAAAADTRNVATSGGGGSPAAAVPPAPGSGGGSGSPVAGPDGTPPSPSGASRQHQQPSSSSSSSPGLSAGQTLSSARIKKTMVALGDAHRALLSQATLLTELFPPGLTTEQLCIRAALRPTTSGAPEVLRYLRHHVHKMVDVLSALPGNRLEMKQDEEDGTASGSGGNRNNGNNRNSNNYRNANGQRGTPRSSMTGQTLRAAAVTAKGRGGGGGGGGPAAEEFDPWALLGDMLDFVRWLRGLDYKSLESRPDLAGGLEQLYSVVGICDQETRRLLGRMDGGTAAAAAAGNGSPSVHPT
ncbi:hypothetical protein Vretimale_7568 [Volvox reticuliferus]|uniref:Uncharacterized protein n=1 Tax=Volvox reticuliferus TaxID=1737510 RepID=A0A8J4CAY4_9CHLO|nr:hypothetical protein Vretifemale_7662 [Volvox reticuliferus]GIM02744.1 hypothetical protein Vretimale_7568 [Volvox reticuliferus]